jgi:hypothetical protein
MPKKISRRQWMSVLAASAGGVGLSSLGTSRFLQADIATRDDAPDGIGVSGSEASPCLYTADGVVQPRKMIDTIHETDVLVVGAGPAGTTAAIAAARAGVKVTLVERYGHFGGLSTGGLVLVILGHWTADGTQVCQGVGEEIMQGLDGIEGGIVNRRDKVNPTVDAEALKYVSLEMIAEAGIDVFLHSWAVDAIMDGPVIRGVVFESKSGRRAILAKQVIDTTGDGDIFAAAGASHEERLYHIGLPYRIGGLDRVDQEATRGQRPPRHLGAVTPINGVRWVNMHGPDANGLDVRELSRLEMEHRRQIWRQVAELKSSPGYEDVYLMETAPQMGVRISRVIDGEETLTIAGVRANREFDDCVAIGGAWNADHAAWQIPYGSLLSKNVDNLLTAGRSLCGEPRMSDLIRVIPNCWVSGQAAGAASATAVRQSCLARDVDIPTVQTLLRSQGAYL